MATRHESFFSYNLTRPYPFKWFTWVVVIGGSIAATLFSILNYATDGFALVPIYTTDPNTTLSTTEWYQRAPFTLTKKFSASCQPVNIPINSEVFTTHLGLNYVVTNVTTNFHTPEETVEPSLNYLNNTLSNCYVDKIRLNAVNHNKNGNGPYWVWDTSTYTIYTTCSLDNGAHPATMSLSATWNVDSYDEFMASVDKINQANLWWAGQLLYASFYEVNEALTGLSADSTMPRLRIDLFPTGETNIHDYSFFSIDFRLYREDGFLIANHEAMGPSPGLYPIGYQLDRMGKLLYSAVMVDLGSINHPNILTDQDSIRKHLEGYTPEFQAEIMKDYADIYNSSQVLDYNLSITPANLYMQYTCQVPAQKGIGSMLIAVLVADLVLLQALYNVFRWVATLMVERRDPTANHCIGCMAQFDVSRLEDEKFEVSSRHDFIPSPPRSPFTVKRKPVSSQYVLVSPIS